MHFFSTNKLVEKAYLLWMVRGKEGSYLLILDSKIEPNNLYPQVGEFCTPFLNGKFLDMVSVDSEFGKNVIKGHKAFYTSK